MTTRMPTTLKQCNPLSVPKPYVTTLKLKLYTVLFLWVAVTSLPDEN